MDINYLKLQQKTDNSLTIPGAIKGQHGFTLVVLAIVLVIVMILATIAIPNFNMVRTSVRNKASVADLSNIEKAIAAYQIEQQKLPATLNDVEMGNQADPWKRPYLFVTPAVLKDTTAVDTLNTDYDLYSKGENGTGTTDTIDPDNYDDIVRAYNGTYIGMRP